MTREEEIETCEEEILSRLRNRANNSVYYASRKDRRDGLKAMFEYLGTLKKYEREYDELAALKEGK
jgi:hypothetical protein